MEKGSPAGDRPTVPRRIISDMKYHIIVAINYRGECYSEILPRNNSINAHRYIQFLEALIPRHRGDLIIMHDNARPHKALMTETFLRENKIGRIPQPPYSPDMNFLDRFVFRNMEVARRGIQLNTIDEAGDFVNNFVSTLNRQSLRNELERFRSDLQAIIDCGGDYLP